MRILNVAFKATFPNGRCGDLLRFPDQVFMAVPIVPGSFSEVPLSDRWSEDAVRSLAMWIFPRLKGHLVDLDDPSFTLLSLSGGEAIDVDGQSATFNLVCSPSDGEEEYDTVLIVSSPGVEVAEGTPFVRLQVQFWVTKYSESSFMNFAKVVRGRQ